MHNKKKPNIESWCQKVLDLLDLTFAELFVILWNYMEHLDSPYTLMVILIILTFSLKQRRKISGIFQIFPGSTLPKPRYPSHANSRDKESLNSSTQAKSH